MPGTLLKMTCFAACIMLAYSFHIPIFSLCTLVFFNITAAVKFSLGYVTVAHGFFGTENAVLPYCVAYTLGCYEIDM